MDFVDVVIEEVVVSVFIVVDDVVEVVVVVVALVSFTLARLFCISVLIVGKRI
ncbi:hypothetical protein KKG31_06405 [Patescibacteria group bacterium]|nr:hypothetical protein [Patescibacteria group bacterium]